MESRFRLPSYSLHNCAKKTYIQHRVAAWKQHTIRPDADDGKGEITLCREYSEKTQLCELFTKAPSNSGSLTDMAEKLQLNQSADPMDTTYVVTSRDEERFVNEIHDHKQELRSSSE